MPVYQDKKRKTWFASFYFKDCHGERRRKKKEGFKTRREAREYEEIFLDQPEKSRDMIFRDLVELYLKDLKSNVRLTTFTVRASVINSRILPYFAERPVLSIKALDVREWQNQLKNEFMNNNKLRTLNYLHHVNICFKAVFNYAVKYLDLPKSPAKDERLGKKRSNEVNFWTIEEFNRFICCIKDEPLAYVIYYLLFWTGIRIGELLALTLEDFDFKNNSFSVNKIFIQLKGQELLHPPKTEKSKRIIFMHEDLSKLVQQYVQRSELKERLFPATRYYLDKVMTQGCQAANIKKIKRHELRHSHASLLINWEVPLKQIAERMGHESIKTTLDIYGHLWPNKQEEIACNLQEIEIAHNSKK